MWEVRKFIEYRLSFVMPRKKVAPRKLSPEELFQICKKELKSQEERVRYNIDYLKEDVRAINRVIAIFEKPIQ